MVINYTKINFLDRDDSKPDSYIVDGTPKIITKDDSGLNTAGTDLNAANLSKIDDALKILSDDHDTPPPTTITVAETIKSLTAGSIEGKVSNLSWPGLTLVNSAKGNFGTTDNWDIVGGASFSVSNNIATVTPVAQFSGISQDISFDANDVVFFYSKLSTTDSDVRFLVSDNLNFTQTIKSFHSGSGEYEEFYDTFNFSTVNKSDLVLRIRSDATSGFSDILIDGKAGVHLINKTALGLTALTELQMLDLVRSGYIDGIQSMYRPKLKIKSKNIIETQYRANNSLWSGDTLTSLEGYQALEPIMLKAGDYHFSTNQSDIFLLLKDKYNNNIISATQTGNSFIITSDIIAYPYVRQTAPPTWDYGLLQNDIELMIEKVNGQNLGEYQKPNHSEVVADLYLRGYNGASDEIYETNNQMFLNKKFDEEILTGTLSTYINGQGLNNDLSYANLNFSNDFKTLTDLSGIAFDGVSSLKVVSSVNLDLGTEKGIRIESSTLMQYAVPTSLLATDDLAGIQAYFDANPPTLVAQLVPQDPINLTEKGLIEGQLESRENGTVYNTSDTFGSADVSFDVPTNRAGQIASLIEANSYQQELIDSKASKVQENVILATLENGWTGSPYYYKNNFGEVKISGLVTAGASNAFTLATGYEPAIAKTFSCSNGAGGTVDVVVGIDGTVTPTATCYLDQIIFRAGE